MLPKTRIRKIQLNVTADEYASIHEIADAAWRSSNYQVFDESVWLNGLENLLGTETRTHWYGAPIAVKVQPKVPSCIHVWPFSSEPNFLCRCKPHIGRWSDVP